MWLIHMAFWGMWTILDGFLKCEYPTNHPICIKWYQSVSLNNKQTIVEVPYLEKHPDWLTKEILIWSMVDAFELIISHMHKQIWSHHMFALSTTRILNLITSFDSSIPIVIGSIPIVADRIQCVPTVRCLHHNVLNPYSCRIYLLFN